MQQLKQIYKFTYLLSNNNPQKKGYSPSYIKGLEGKLKDSKEELKDAISKGERFKGKK